MKHVRDISEPKIGSYIRFRVGAGPRESDIIQGQVKEMVVDRTGFARHAFLLDNGEMFNFWEGDRIERITQTPPRNLARTQRVDDEAHRKTITERLHYQREHATLKRERDLTLMVAVASLAALIVYAGVRDGATIVAWVLQ
jgi:hypothetical protein